MIEVMRIIPFSFIWCFAILGSITIPQHIVFVSSKILDGDPLIASHDKERIDHDSK